MLTVGVNVRASDSSSLLDYVRVISTPIIIIIIINVFHRFLISYRLRQVFLRNGCKTVVVVVVQIHVEL